MNTTLTSIMGLTCYNNNETFGMHQLVTIKHVVTITWIDRTVLIIITATNYVGL